MAERLFVSRNGLMSSAFLFFFFFQAEDGIRDRTVTGVQTCALPISDRLDLDADLLVGRQVQRLIGDNHLAVEMGVERDHSVQMIARTRSTSESIAQIGRASCRERV